jgi:hypothetical protein
LIGSGEEPRLRRVLARYHRRRMKMVPAILAWCQSARK